MIMLSGLTRVASSSLGQTNSGASIRNSGGSAFCKNNIEKLPQTQVVGTNEASTSQLNVIAPSLTSVVRYLQGEQLL